MRTLKDLEDAFPLAMNYFRQGAISFVCNDIFLSITMNDGFRQFSFEDIQLIEKALTK